MPGRSATVQPLYGPGCRRSFLVHRHAGEVAHVLVGAGELVEQRGLAAVLVARPGRTSRGVALRQRSPPARSWNRPPSPRPGCGSGGCSSKRRRMRVSAAAVGAGAHVLHLDAAARRRAAASARSRGRAPPSGSPMGACFTMVTSTSGMMPMSRKAPAQRPLAAHRDHCGGFPDGKVVQRCQRVSPRVVGTTPSPTPLVIVYFQEPW